MTSTKPAYYGAFFWLATVSFIVPVFVAVRAFQEVPVTSKPESDPDASGVDHNLWDYLLKTYVAHGLVDYDGMSRDYLFRTYLRQLAECNVSKLPTTGDRLALLINAYNAFVINGVITHDISDSVIDYKHEGTEFFDLHEHIFAGRTMSLNHMEHDIIRKAFAEPRIHVALVCAAKSCPAIRSEAFVGARLSSQLADQARLFANAQKYVTFDAASNQLMLNPILKWYGEDWKNDGGYLAWLEERVTDPALKQAITATRAGTSSLGWMEYDWALNAQSTSHASTSAASGHAEFGSGSVPNE